MAGLAVDGAMAGLGVATFVLVCFGTILCSRRKYACIAYVLWAFGGLLGVHHLYLSRHARAFLWATSFGVFGFGWLVDALFIPSEIESMGNSEASAALIRAVQAHYPKPRLEVGPCLLGVTAGWYYCLLFTVLAANLGISSDLSTVTGTVGSVVGTLLGWACSDYQRVSMWQVALAGGSAGLLSSSKMVALLVANLAAYFSRRYVTLETAKATRTKKRVGLTIIAIIGFFVLLAATMLHCTTDGQGRFHCSTNERFDFSNLGMDDPDSWEQFAKGMFDRLQTSMDATSAFETLNLQSTASKAEIKSAYRKLARQWHPDKHPSSPEQAEQKMIEINKAYEVLTKYMAHQEL